VSPLKLGLEPVKAVFSATLASAIGLMVDANIDNVYEVIIIATDVDNNTDSETQTVAITFVSETILFKGLTYKTIASHNHRDNTC
jgi:hypothetical protein